MNITLKRDKDGKFKNTPPHELKVSDDDFRVMGEHRNDPVTEKSIFTIANEGHDAKQKRNSKNDA